MYRVRIRLYAELNDHLPAAARQTWLERTFAPGERVGDLLRALQVPSEEVDLVLLNGISAALTDPVPDGARLSAFPVFERLDIRPLARLPDRPLRAPRFAAERELARLATALRLLGFEARAAAPGTAVLAGEILVTRDPALPERMEAARAVVVRESRAVRQARELLQALQLENLAHRVRRCPRCGQVEPIGRCAGCGRRARGSSLVRRIGRR
jgi:hypothetical protein